LVIKKEFFNNASALFDDKRDENLKDKPDEECREKQSMQKSRLVNHVG
jgi:hypothetical protein